MKNFDITKLIGATNENELVFANLCVTTRNGYPEFSASFDCVRPITENEVEDGIEYYEELLESCYDDGQKYKMCEQYDCCPSELAERLLEQNGEDVQDIRDCSLYPDIIDVDGTDYYFESGSCGQHDTRNEIETYVDENAYNKIHELWDKFHLKEITEETYNEIRNVIDSLLEDEEQEHEWIKNYIMKNIITLWKICV